VSLPDAREPATVFQDELGVMIASFADAVLPLQEVCMYRVVVVTRLLLLELLLLLLLLVVDALLELLLLLDETEGLLM